MKKQKLVSALALGAVAMGAGVTLGLTTDSSALSVIPLQINPEYQQYRESVQAGHASDWKLIPTQYIKKVDAGLLSDINFSANDTLPTSYDLRKEKCGDGDCATRVKDQGYEGICWAYATTTAMESSFLKSTGKKIELSPKQLDYAIADPATALTDSTSNNYYTFIKGLGVERVLTDGGNFQLANFFIGSQYGATLESPFFAGMQANDPDLSAYSSYEQRAAVSPYTTKMPSSLIFNNSKENNYAATSTTSYSISSTDSEIVRMATLQGIKQQIMAHGAMSLSTFFNRSSSICYDASTQTIMDHGSLKCGSSNGHAMSIIGWDDDHMYNDPSTNAMQKGAFLVQNSWGEGIPETYVWIAYAYDLTVDGINTVEQNHWDIVYDEANAQQLGGVTRAANEVIAKYHANGEQKINQIALNDFMAYTGAGKAWDVYVSTTGQAADFQPVGTINVDTILSAGRRQASLDKDITVNGDFLIKVKSALDGMEIPDEVAPMFAINAYATGDVGPTPTPTPDDPDIPVPNTDGGGELIGAPNTGFFSASNAVLATIILLPLTVAGCFAGRVLYQRYGNRVSFKK